jgi:type I restriction enzyme S subunit
MRRYLRVANVFEARIDLSDVMEMDFTDEEFETYRLHAGDILLNEGQSPHLVGRPAMWHGQEAEMCFTNSLVRFQAAPGVVPAYALTVFRAQLSARRYMKLVTITTNIAHLGAQRFAAVEFPLAPLAEQHRIVAEVDRRLSVLDALDASLDANLARCARLRQAVLKRAVEGRLVSAEGMADAPSK